VTAESTPQTYRVLVVEDDADTRANLADILELDGFEVLTAGTAAEALARSDWDQIAIALLDRKLPDGNALDLLPRIRQLAPQITIMVVTAMLDLEGAITALRSGAADYILKPINPDALRASVVRVTDRLRMETKLRETQEQLEEQQRKVLQNERLAAIGETMTALIHESRNALQRSKACLEMLALDVQDRPKALDLVVRIQRAQDDLQYLYEEVRGYAAPIVLNRRECDLAQLWRETWEQLAAEHEPNQLKLKESLLTDDLRAVVDRSSISRVFRNILENAIAASPASTLVTVTAIDTEINGKPAVSIAFKDSGPGLSAEQQRRIFEPFFTTKTKGTGLGMAISLRIVQSHGGDISAGNSSTGGATIHVILPRVLR
jgi:signal transduction histidine kinase